jgi:replicative DNA helicase
MSQNGNGLLEKIPPHALDAELSVLGAILLAPDAADRLGDLLREDDFYQDANREIFRAVKTLRDKNKPVDPVTVAKYLEKHKLLGECGGSGYLQTIIETVPHSAYVRFYGEIVKERAERRKIIEWAGEAIKKAYDFSEEPEDIAAGLEDSLFKIRGKNAAGGSQKIAEMLAAYFEQLDKSTQQGVQTNLTKLNELTSGFQKSHLIVVAARPSVGKTALAMNFMLKAAADGVKTYFVSLEQSAREVSQRTLAILSGIDSHRLGQNDQLTDDECQEMLNCKGYLDEHELWVDDQSGLTIGQIASRARYLKRRENIGLVVIDYLQLIEPEDRRVNREQQVATISRRLKNLAKQLDVPVVILAQLNRESEKGKVTATFKERTPQLHNLRESGAIEQDANVIILLHRMQETEDGQPKPTEAQILVRKNRDGRTGKFWATFAPHCLRFQDKDVADDWLPEGF